MDQHVADFMKMDDDFESFIKKYINTFVKWELVQFFHNNDIQPFSINELSKKLNRSAKTLKSEISELVSNGMLVNLARDEMTVRLVEDNKEVLDLMQRFVKFCESREGRLRVIYKILKDGKPINN